ncbi:MAG TPA: hypothetical protein VEH06_00420 [Candidatus Bathyarchaeia archaeon]|nr:hypothetical protein [Candidatus Bathyarchaeia archaeon]
MDVISQNSSGSVRWDINSIIEDADNTFAVQILENIRNSSSGQG